ncbi:hypothetical protein ACPW96_21600 [Micromonospora sp. DT81.3]|uniref:Mom family adenine methylcarbamoylation protein n=1 Tax=Micromonospora sp. DT81.3 TaxID=3416523 RepID=UPI003CE86692
MLIQGLPVRPGTQVSEVRSPSSENCQRWDKGKPSWRHPTDGGFDASLYTVTPLPEAAARAFVEAEHYAGSFPAARFSFGLLTRDDRFPINGAIVDGQALVGVATFSTPMTQRVLTQVFPDLTPYEESIELGRFVLTDTPANAESWFLRRAFQLAAAAGIRGVVSFADPLPRHRRVLEVDDDGTSTERVEVTTPGHCGLIYQATNATACGRSTPRTLNYHPRRGLVLSERTLQKVRAQESGAASAEKHLVTLGAPIRRAGEDPRAWLRDALEAMQIVKVRHPGNWRYAFAIGSPSQRRRVRIALPPTHYPKPATDLLPAIAT